MRRKTENEIKRKVKQIFSENTDHCNGYRHIKASTRLNKLQRCGLRVFPFQTKAEMKEELETMWHLHPGKFAGYTFVSASSTSVVRIRCSKGHEILSRMTDLRKQRGCSHIDCSEGVVHTQDSIRNKILEAWGRSAKYHGYEILNVTYGEEYWNFEYRCAAGHQSSAVLTTYDGESISPCSHVDHPYNFQFTEEQTKEQILDAWNADKLKWNGYEVIKVGQYSREKTIIKCGRGHLSDVTAMHIVRLGYGCTHKECVAIRNFQSGTNYKKLWQNLKQYLYQGHEDKLLRILFARFSSDCIETNANLAALCHPVSFRYLFENSICCYYPNIRVESAGHTRWYEVKSDWTYDCCGIDDNLRERNHEKWKTVSRKTKAAFDAYIWGNDCNDLRIIRYYMDGTFKQYKSVVEADNDEAIIYLD